MTKMQRNHFIFAISFSIITIFFYIYIFYISRNKFTIINQYSSIQQTKLNVFIDLGANKGDSVLNFLNLSPKAQGGIINKGIFNLKFDSTKWIIYLFEANKFFDDKLIKVKNDIEKLNHKVYLHKSTAAWILDGTIDFYLDTINKDVDFWGSSVNNNHPDVVKSNRTKESVRSVDIARIIKQYRQRDNVIVKMDIEGAEYDLLQDFIKKDVMNLIDYLAVEFHAGLSPFKNSEEIFISLIKLFGVKFLNWT